MTIFLTSSFCIREEERIDPTAGLLEEVKKRLPREMTGVFICSNPGTYEITDFYGESTANCFRNEGFSFRKYTIVDERNDEGLEACLAEADLIILSGGHVPTQNSYFRKIGLKEILERLSPRKDKVLIGISAGTMNCADTVYAHPEEDGEAVDPHYQRYLKGLGLTHINVLPHYDELKDLTLDGLRVIEDIAFPDSFSHPILVLPDGSYVLCENGREEIRGRAWWLKNGVMTPCPSSDAEQPFSVENP